MVAKSDFVVSVDTGKAIHDELLARSFLSDWLEHPLVQLRPERWGRSEPVRYPIASTPFEQLVSEWGKVALMFVRVSRPKMKVSLNWRRNKGLDARPFPWGLTAWLARNGGPEVARAFLELIVKHFEPAFASLTTDEESHRKHFFKEPHYVNGLQTGTAESFRGHHVLDTLPGIYWMTYLGQSLVDRVGEQKLKSIPTGRLEPYGSGYLLTAYDDPSIVGSDEGRAIEQRIIDHLGKHIFFSREMVVTPKMSEERETRH